MHSLRVGIKGTVRVISVTPPCKGGNVRFTTVPLKKFDQVLISTLCFFFENFI